MDSLLVLQFYLQLEASHFDFTFTLVVEDALVWLSKRRSTSIEFSGALAHRVTDAQMQEVPDHVAICSAAVKEESVSQFEDLTSQYSHLPRGVVSPMPLYIL